MITEQELLDFMRETAYKPLTYQELEKHFQPDGDAQDFKDFLKLLNNLEQSGAIYRTRSERYGVPERMNLLKGRMQIHAKGFGFLIPEEEGHVDVYIHANDLGSAMNGDIVLVRVNSKSPAGGRLEGEVVKVVHRAVTQIVGTFENLQTYGFITPDDKRITRDIFIPTGKFMGAVTGMKVVANIVSYPEGRAAAEGEIVEILGHKDDPGVDILSIIRKFQLPESFPEEVMAEAEQAPDVIREEELQGRRDLRGKRIVTIDGEDAKDLDDAVQVERLENGNYLLGVHIADVSYYVRENSQLDQEAYRRGCSVYLVDRVIPMLPHRLSNGICSLNPQVDRLTMSCEMEIDEQANVVKHDIFTSVIKTTERMTYTNVRKLLRGEEGLAAAVDAKLAAEKLDLGFAGQGSSRAAGGKAAGDKGRKGIGDTGHSGTSGKEIGDAEQKSRKGISLRADGARGRFGSEGGSRDEATLHADSISGGDAGSEASGQLELGSSHVPIHSLEDEAERDRLLEVAREELKQLQERYAPLMDDFRLMEELAMKLRSKRMRRGAIDFDFQESKILVDENGKPTGIVKRERSIAEMIIEEFMLAANETVAEHFHWLKVPFLYRVHDDPNAEKLQHFLEFVSNFGYTVRGGKGNTVHPRALQSLLEDIKGTTEETVISTVLLRSMKQAKYDAESLGHFGLATDFYTHFTSPIRRYPDLIIHRVIREVLENGGTLTDQRVEALAPKMADIARQSSERERVAVDAERETDALKKAEFMLDKVGEIFDGIISSVTNFGIFVELHNTVEGLIRLSDLADDYYHYHENLHALIGERTSKMYRIGDEVKVRVARVNIGERTIDFDMVDTRPRSARMQGEGGRGRGGKGPRGGGGEGFTRAGSGRGRKGGEAAGGRKSEAGGRKGEARSGSSGGGAGGGFDGKGGTPFYVGAMKKKKK